MYKRVRTFLRLAMLGWGFIGVVLLCIRLNPLMPWVERLAARVCGATPMEAMWAQCAWGWVFSFVAIVVLCAACFLLFMATKGIYRFFFGD